jgi:putative redox protein
MKLECSWNEKMQFTAQSGEHKVEMDAKAPLGSDTALTPKQLLVAGICGCTAMDVVALLKKHKQTIESFQIEADAVPTEGVYPAVYSEIKLVFKLKGSLDESKVLESVALSQTKYCGVSAMVSKAVPISYTVELNGKNIGAGRAEFK